MLNPVYRITVQLLNTNGDPGEIVEMMELERLQPWTTVFDFVDQYRAEQETLLQGYRISAYENIRLPAKAVAPYRKVAQETGIPLLRLIAMALERFEVQGVAHAMQKAIKP